MLCERSRLNLCDTDFNSDLGVLDRSCKHKGQLRKAPTRRSTPALSPVGCHPHFDLHPSVESFYTPQTSSSISKNTLT